MEASNDKTHVTVTPDVSHIKNVNVAHETSDVQIGGIVKFVIGLAIFTVAVYLLMWGLFRTLESRAVKEEPAPGPLTLSEEERLPPEPRLQEAPGFAEDLQKTAKSQEAEEGKPEPPRDRQWEIRVLRERWNSVLEHGPTDDNGKPYGMPIEKAKEELLKKGLPVRGQEAGGRSRSKEAGGRE